MMESEFLRKLVIPAETKIVMIILDGLGGLPLESGGRTELESARTPNMDMLAANTSLGLTVPAGPGITVGSGPGHLALFGYDPIKYEIGRGALEAFGVDFEMEPGDIAARGNFCSVSSDGIITDRRAGRLPTETSFRLAAMLRTIRVYDFWFFIEPVKEHRFAFIMRGSGLGDALTDTDPLNTGKPPLQVNAINDGSIKAARVVNNFINQAGRILKDQRPANMILLRGFSGLPDIPQFGDQYGLHPAAIALNGMYRGVARLAGMTVLEVAGKSIRDEFETLEKHWGGYDFFYLHIKQTDTCGENGDFSGKVQAIEEVDSFVPQLMALKPDVVIICGDHSSPAVMRSHSWHPVPLLIYSKYSRSDGFQKFGESACRGGSLGVLPAKDVMQIALANSGRLAKYGA
jgi:2,3-bisphosphoglycerate-independent phosphoglycerate mutase